MGNESLKMLPAYQMKKEKKVNVCMCVCVLDRERERRGEKKQMSICIDRTLRCQDTLFSELCSLQISHQANTKEMSTSVSFWNF